MWMPWLKSIIEKIVLNECKSALSGSPVLYFFSDFKHHRPASKKHPQPDGKSSSSYLFYIFVCKVEDFCHRMGWHLDEGLTLVTEDDLELDLMQMTSDGLEPFLQYAWRQHVACALSQRKDFAGLQGLDFEASFAMRRLSSVDQELLHCIQDGTFHLRSYRAKFDPTVDADCPHCHQLDTLQHRALQCSYYADVREQYQDCVEAWPAVSVALSHHGLASRNPWQISYWKVLATLPLDGFSWMVTPAGG